MSKHLSVLLEILSTYIYKLKLYIPDVKIPPLINVNVMKCNVVKQVFLSQGGRWGAQIGKRMA